MHADEVNDYLREIDGGRLSAKDFRTWHGTAKAAAELAAAGPRPMKTARKKVVAAVMRDVAEILGTRPRSPIAPM